MNNRQSLQSNPQLQIPGSASGSLSIASDKNQGSPSISPNGVRIARGPVSNIPPRAMSPAPRGRVLQAVGSQSSLLTGRALSPTPGLQQRMGGLNNYPHPASPCVQRAVSPCLQRAFSPLPMRQNNFRQQFSSGNIRSVTPIQGARSPTAKSGGATRKSDDNLTPTNTTTATPSSTPRSGATTTRSVLTTAATSPNLSDPSHAHRTGGMGMSNGKSHNPPTNAYASRARGGAMGNAMQRVGSPTPHQPAYSSSMTMTLGQNIQRARTPIRGIQPPPGVHVNTPIMALGITRDRSPLAPRTQMNPQKKKVETTETMLIHRLQQLEEKMKQQESGLLEMKEKAVTEEMRGSDDEDFEKKEREEAMRFEDMRKSRTNLNAMDLLNELEAAQKRARLLERQSAKMTQETKDKEKRIKDMEEDRITMLDATLAFQKEIIDLKGRVSSAEEGKEKENQDPTTDGDREEIKKKMRTTSNDNIMKQALLEKNRVETARLNRELAEVKEKLRVYEEKEKNIWRIRAENLSTRNGDDQARILATAQEEIERLTEINRSLAKLTDEQTAVREVTRLVLEVSELRHGMISKEKNTIAHPRSPEDEAKLADFKFRLSMMMQKEKPDEHLTEINDIQWRIAELTRKDPHYSARPRLMLHLNEVVQRSVEKMGLLRRLNKAFTSIGVEGMVKEQNMEKVLTQWNKDLASIDKTEMSSVHLFKEEETLLKLISDELNTYFDELYQLNEDLLRVRSRLAKASRELKRIPEMEAQLKRIPELEAQLKRIPELEAQLKRIPVLEAELSESQKLFQRHSMLSLYQPSDAGAHPYPPSQSGYPTPPFTPPYASPSLSSFNGPPPHNASNPNPHNAQVPGFPPQGAQVPGFNGPPPHNASNPNPPHNAQVPGFQAPQGAQVPGFNGPPPHNAQASGYNGAQERDGPPQGAPISSFGGPQACDLYNAQLTGGYNGPQASGPPHNTQAPGFNGPQGAQIPGFGGPQASDPYNSQVTGFNGPQGAQLSSFSGPQAGGVPPKPKDPKLAAAEAKIKIALDNTLEASQSKVQKMQADNMAMAAEYAQKKHEQEEREAAMKKEMDRLRARARKTTINLEPETMLFEGSLPDQ